MKRFAFILVLLLGRGIESVPAQDVVLSVSNAVVLPGDTVSVSVDVYNRIAISGMAFDLKYDASILRNLEATVQNAPFKLYAHPESGVLRMILLDPVAGRKLESGTHKLVSLLLTLSPEAALGPIALALANLTATDGNTPVKRVACRGIDGELRVMNNALRPGTMHWISRDSLAVSLVLDNQQPLSGLQVTVKLSPAGPTPDVVIGVNRASDWTCFSGPQDEGFRIVCADFSGKNPIVPGAGAVFNLPMLYPSGADTTAVWHMALSEVLATDDTGRQVPVVGLQGNVNLGSRPELVTVLPDTTTVPIPEDTLSAMVDVDTTHVSTETVSDSSALTEGADSIAVSGVDTTENDGAERGTADADTVDERDLPDSSLVGVQTDGDTLGIGYSSDTLVVSVPDTVGPDSSSSTPIEDADTLAATGSDTVGGDLPDSTTSHGPLGSTGSDLTTIRLAEILADPPPGSAGDANRDGVRDSREDEFVELVNSGPTSVDIGRCLLGDDDVAPDQMFRFPEPTILAPEARAVVFGGGAPQGFNCPVFADDGSIGNGLTNSGDTVLLLSPDGRDTIDRAAFPAAKDQSLVLADGRWLPHKDGVRNLAFSPGVARPTIQTSLLKPERRQIHVGETLKLGAAVTYSDSVEIDLPDNAPSWTIADTTVAHISSDGTVTGLAAGDVGVWFVYREMKSLHATITVLPETSDSDNPYEPAANHPDTTEVTADADSSASIATVDTTTVPTDAENEADSPGPGGSADTIAVSGPDTAAADLSATVDTTTTSAGTDSEADSPGGFADTIAVSGPDTAAADLSGRVAASEDTLDQETESAESDTAAVITDVDSTIVPIDLGTDSSERGDVPDTVAIGETHWYTHDSLGVVVTVHNRHPISGLQVVVKAPYSQIEFGGVSGVNRATAWSCFAGPFGDRKLRLLAADFSGAAPIAPGTGAVLDLRMRDRANDDVASSWPFDLVEALASGGDGHQVPVVTVNGRIDFRGRPKSVAALIDTANTSAMEKENGAADSLEEASGSSDQTQGLEDAIDTVTVSDRDIARSDTASPAFSDSLANLPDWSTVRIVEILADPPSGEAGDANRDGTRDSREDEFVELLNTGAVSVDIGGCSLGDDDVTLKQMFHFPDHTILAPGERSVVFGGGDPQGFSDKVFADDGSFGNGLTNSGDTVLFLSPAGSDTIDAVSFSAAKAQSVVLVDGRWVPHKDGVRNLAFSPGTPMPKILALFPRPPQSKLQVGETAKLTAAAFYSDNVRADIPEGAALWTLADTTLAQITPDGMLTGRAEGKTEAWFTSREKESLRAEVIVISDSSAIQKSPPQSVPSDTESVGWAIPKGLVFSEIYPAPGVGLTGDANRDGVRDAYSDEFVELANWGLQTVDLSRFYLGDDDVATDRMFRFPEGTALPPGAYAVVFGGGKPTDLPGMVFTDDGRIGDGLSNSGDTVQLVAPDGQTVVLKAAYTGSQAGVSWTRDVSGRFLLHNELPGYGNFSPGQQQAQLIGLHAGVERIELEEKEHFVMKVWGLFSQGDSLDLSTGVTWTFSNPGIADMKGMDMVGMAIGRTRAVASWGNIASDSILVVVRAPGNSGADDETGTDGPAGSEPGAPSPVKLQGLNVSEIYAAPARGPAGDANGDGRRDGYEDEFVELANAGPDTLDLSGWLLGDDDVPTAQLFRFPKGTSIRPGERVTLFGGGAPKGIAGLVFVDDGRIGDGLSNAGDTVRLVSPDGQTEVLRLSYPECTDGVSWARTGGQWALHNALPGKDMRSPGRPRPVLTALRINPAQGVLQVEEKMTFKVTGIFSDETRLPLSSGYEFEVFPDSVVTLTGNSALGIGVGSAWAKARRGSLETNIVSIRVVQALSEGSRDSISDPQEPTNATNHPPVFLTVPDSIAVVGLPYHYRPGVQDPDRDTVTFDTERLPLWLKWQDDEVIGTPGTQDAGPATFMIQAFDGKENAFQSVRIEVVAPQEMVAPLSAKPALDGMTWRQKLDVPPEVQVQVDGGPEWHADTRELVWKPTMEQKGAHRVTVAFSREGAETVFADVVIQVKPRPQLALLEVDPSPDSDTNGDGRVDPFEDQFLVIGNRSTASIDLSGWLLGDDDRSPVRIPDGTHLAPNARLTLFGKCDAGPGRLSAGGRIGNGLARSDRVLLIAPSGPDTLINEAYHDARPGVDLVKDDSGQLVSDVPEAASAGEAHVPELAAFPVDTQRGDKDMGGAIFLHPVPNPFNAHTVLGFYSFGGQVQVTIYSILGQPVRRLVHRSLPAGYYQRIWDGTTDRGQILSSGVYLIRVENRRSIFTQRVTLLR